MSEATSGAGADYVPAALYAEVQQFYARQMNLLEGEAADPDAWAETFTEDAVFESAGEPEPQTGREDLRETVRAGVNHIAAQGLDFRHWFGMVGVEQRPDDTLRTRYYALAMATPQGGPLKIRGSLLCHDDLVRGEDGRLLVRRRSLDADGRER
ncbi:nuclear transport factor 2 family protein [Streptomyces lavendulae]|uniref:Polyketide cyclase n=2 Tax=Streptomycetaceae TaxID=2062 RepID=E1ARK7_KITAU|nr:nuclear transport factor 2 family protein [Streptomyces lavendulae]ADM72826.2 polyketide cyclase [Streptomyces lavendulae subsp. lavendulae]ATZ29844.1 SnoaL-like domain protein [Streptomyces lavendulae subsp. lavendulae]